MQRVARRYNGMVSTQWAGTVSLGTRSTSVKKSDLVKAWFASTGAKPMGHDDENIF